MYIETAIAYNVCMCGVGTELRALCILGMCCTTELHPTLLLLRHWEIMDFMIYKLSFYEDIRKHINVLSHIL